MMTPRQRMLAAINYNNPDCIPVVYHPSPAGLYVHGQKLLDLFNQYPPDNPIHLDSIPLPSPGTTDKNGEYHEIRTDEWGTEWQHRIFGVYGHPHNYPFTGWSAAKDYQFPPLPLIDAADVTRQQARFLVISGGISLFERICALRPIDEVLMDLQLQDADLLRFLDRLVDYWSDVIARLLSAGVDSIFFGDDWGTQTAPILSPSLFRQIFKPRYEKLMAPIRQANRMIFFHSCGFLGEIFDELVDLGICGLWPQIGLFEADPSYHRKCTEHRITLYIHPDRQCLIPLGTPKEIETRIKDYATIYHDLRGGGIFYIEIENDAPFENVKTLIESVNHYR